MKKIWCFLTLTILLVGCNNEVTEEQTTQPNEGNISEDIKYGEHMSMEKALSAVSFVPKQISKDNSPFPIKKTGASLNKTDKPSEIIELGYGGYGHSITLIVENTQELKEDTALDWDASMQYEEIALEKSKTALYAEGENSHHILWVEDGLSYFMNLSYKIRISPKPVRFSKTEIIEIVNNLE
ncbi:hypothetical protein GH741_12600 [Aquibacillus halophilus]|uniref:DUF4367 domain-containing protein n=1 Tax=Aquibacillus halophilus TaxID=930132 RepID=A0A6A8DI99_9BACI|nr:hypothetical protein [Aquibacillus halophilus]MRH43519.1 hypothetical protein [Aquibacillus halophilus]